jgi:hypothetical protein
VLIIQTGLKIQSGQMPLSDACQSNDSVEQFDASLIDARFGEELFGLLLREEALRDRSMDSLNVAVWR